MSLWAMYDPVCLYPDVSQSLPLEEILLTYTSYRRLGSNMNRPSPFIVNLLVMIIR